MVGQRPQEGQAIREAFEQQSNEISQVRDLVQHFEAHGSGTSGASPAAGTGTVPFTREMDASMNEIFHKVARFDQIASGMNTTQERLNVIGQNLEGIDVSRRTCFASQPWHSRGRFLICLSLRTPRRKRRFHEKSYYSLGRTTTFWFFTVFFSDFLGRLQPSKTTIQNQLVTLRPDSTTHRSPLSAA